MAAKKPMPKKKMPMKPPRGMRGAMAQQMPMSQMQSSAKAARISGKKPKKSARKPPPVSYF